MRKYSILKYLLVGCAFLVGNIVIPISNNKAVACNEQKNIEQKNIIQNVNALSNAKKDIKLTYIDQYQKFIDSLYGKCKTLESYKDELTKYCDELDQMTQQNANSSITNNTDSNESPKQTILENILKNFTGYYITHYDDYIKGDYKSKDNENKLNNDTLLHAILLDSKSYYNYLKYCVDMQQEKKKDNFAFLTIEILDKDNKQVRFQIDDDIKNNISKKINFSILNNENNVTIRKNYKDFQHHKFWNYFDKRYPCTDSTKNITHSILDELSEYSCLFPGCCIIYKDSNKIENCNVENSTPTCKRHWLIKKNNKNIKVGYVYSRMYDEEVQLLLCLYDILKKSTQLQQNNSVNNNDHFTVNINLFTYLDMCQFCWSMWHKYISELKILFAKYLNTSEENVTLKLNVYYHYINPYYSTKLLNGREDNVDVTEKQYNKLFQDQSILQEDAIPIIMNDLIFWNAFMKCNKANDILKQSISQKLKEPGNNTESPIQRFWDSSLWNVNDLPQIIQQYRDKLSNQNITCKGTTYIELYPSLLQKVQKFGEYYKTIQNQLFTQYQLTPVKDCIQRIISIIQYLQKDLQIIQNQSHTIALSKNSKDKYIKRKLYLDKDYDSQVKQYFDKEQLPKYINSDLIELSESTDNNYTYKFNIQHIFYFLNKITSDLYSNQPVNKNDLKCVEYIYQLLNLIYNITKKS